MQTAQSERASEPPIGDGPKDGDSVEDGRAEVLDLFEHSRNFIDGIGAENEASVPFHKQERFILRVRLIAVAVDLLVIGEKFRVRFRQTVQYLEELVGKGLLLDIGNSRLIREVHDLGGFFKTLGQRRFQEIGQRQTRGLGFGNQDRLFGIGLGRLRAGSGRVGALRVGDDDHLNRWARHRFTAAVRPLLIGIRVGNRPEGGGRQARRNGEDRQAA